MQPFELSRVPAIFFGAGCLSRLGREVAARLAPGGAVMIIADPAMRSLGWTDRVTGMLAAKEIRNAVYAEFKGEPKVSEIDRATAAARDLSAGLVVGIGGGSALDTAKLVAATTRSGLSAAAYALCDTPLPLDALPVIAIPSTAGTGSEVTRTSVFALESGVKTWAWGDPLKPVAALLDPELTLTLPPPLTAATALDALVHAIEAATNARRNAGNDLFCHRAINLITRNLERAIKDGSDMAARGALLLGSCYAGIAIDNGGTALAHNISHAVAALAPIAHGRATALAMLATMDWVAEAVPEAFAAVAQAMGETPEPDAAVSAFAHVVRASGLKISLRDDGLELNRPELLAAQMAQPQNAPMRKATVRPVRDEDLVMLAQRFYGLADGWR
ncbi:MAG TPA: iron-containing alcohol dehydrogenase [Aestuariivirgaceae bacterium]|jgi:alcohol dehydrogenase|nr:iron-containing alcohol dehydrogenase [Aestuariivirgaceae bacterium]